MQVPVSEINRIVRYVRERVEDPQTWEYNERRAYKEDAIYNSALQVAQWLGTLPCEALTTESPRWSEFYCLLDDTLAMPDGRRRCGHDRDHGGDPYYYAKEVMAEMGNVDGTASCAFFATRGGGCDCEILRNVDPLKHKAMEALRRQRLVEAEALRRQRLVEAEAFSGPGGDAHLDDVPW